MAVLEAPVTIEKFASRIRFIPSNEARQSDGDPFCSGM